MTITPDTATTWRDLTAQLKPSQIERLIWIEDRIAEGSEPVDSLELARGFVAENVVEHIIFGNVARPADAQRIYAGAAKVSGAWEREFMGTCRTVGAVEVNISGRQQQDGQVERDIAIEARDPFDSATARQIAAALVSAADEIDGLAYQEATAACSICDDRGRIRMSATPDGVPTHRGSLCRHDETEASR